MKIPDSVHILGQDYKVERRGKKDMPKLLGWCDVNKNVVQLRDTLSGDKLGEIFLHECIHAIEQQMSLDLTEKQVNSLGVGVYAFLKDNGYV